MSVEYHLLVLRLRLRGTLENIFLREALAQLCIKNLYDWVHDISQITSLLLFKAVKGLKKAFKICLF